MRRLDQEVHDAIERFPLSQETVGSSEPGVHSGADASRRQRSCICGASGATGREFGASIHHDQCGMGPVRQLSNHKHRQLRSTWLINNVNWITTANSRCQKFSIPACPTARTIWKVMVLTGSGTRSVVREEAPLEAAAC